jgi:hypothetical protein
LNHPTTEIFKRVHYLILLYRWRLGLSFVVTALTVASFCVCVYLNTRAPEVAFYSPFARGWELFAGSLLSLWHERRDTPLSVETWVRRLSWEILALGAFAAFAVAIWGYAPSTPFPGYFTLLPVVGAVVLIGGRKTGLHRRFLAAPPVVFVGLISYPLYLWHFPLMAYARIHYAGSVPPQVMCAFLALSGFLAWLTYRFVEAPIRFGRKRSRFQIGVLVSAMAALGLVGIVAQDTYGLPVRYPAAIRGFMVTGRETSPYWRLKKCMLLGYQDDSDFAPECDGGSEHPLVLLWGDSYAAALYPGLAHFATDRGYAVAQYTSSACAPLIGYSNPYRLSCAGTNNYVLGRIAQLKPDVVILDSTWRLSEEDARAGLKRTADALKALNVNKVVALGPVATWVDDLPTNVRDYFSETGSVLPERTWYRTNDAWTRPADVFLAQMAGSVGLAYVSMRNIMCDEDGCVTRIGPNGSQLMSFDTGHLTVPGSILMADRVLNGLTDLKH